MEGGHDLPLGDRLAPTDHPAIPGVLGDEGVFLLGGEVLEHHVGPLVHKVRFGLQVRLPLQNPFTGPLANGGAGRQTGGLDPRQVEEAGVVGALLQNEVGAGGVGPQSGEVADVLPKVEAGHRAHGLLLDKGQSLGGVAQVVAVIHRLGVGAYNEIAVDGGGH